MTEPEIRFTERLSGRSPRQLALLVGACLVIVVGAAVTMAASPSTSPAPGSSAAPQASGAPLRPNLKPGKGFGGGMLDGRGRFGGVGFGGITITSISGSNLTLKTDDGWTRTITATSATTISKGGQTITVGQLAVGDQIRFSQTKASDGSFSITAIQVVLPKVAGKVTAVTSDSITVTIRGGTTKTIATTGTTAYRLGGAAANHADVVVGSTILATGTEGANGSFTASTVAIEAQRAAGTVSKTTASTITITRRDGSSQTINVDASTTYQVQGVPSAKLSDVAVGMKVAAAGRLNADGSLDATAVRAGNGRIKDGPKNHDGTNQPAPSGAPSTTG
jgi:hypothetical protein